MAILCVGALDWIASVEATDSNEEGRARARLQTPTRTNKQTPLEPSWKICLMREVLAAHSSLLLIRRLSNFASCLLVGACVHDHITTGVTQKTDQKAHREGRTRSLQIFSNLGVR